MNYTDGSIVCATLNFLNNMKKISLFSAAFSVVAGAFLCAPSQAAVTTLWVDGVSQSGGWHDANKANPRAEDGDNNLCYAASASNLIAWWQSKYTVPTGTPNTLDAIWARYKEGSNTDTGGDTGGAVQWWLTGVYMPTTDEEQERAIFGKSTSSTLDSFEGYYYDQCNLSQWSKKQYYEDANGDLYAVMYPKEVEAFLCTSYRPRSDASYLSSIGSSMLELVGKGCGMGLSIADDAGELAHAITLWGIEYDDTTNAISKLWLTDSDDAQYSLNQDGLFAVEVKETDGKLYISTPDSNWYTKEEKVYVDGIFAIDPSVSADWGLAPAAAVPEPATATLSLLALAALAARRRRKK